MSNKSSYNRRSNNAQKGLNFKDILQKAGEQARAKQLERESGEKGDGGIDLDEQRAEKEDLNILPFPIKQEIVKDKWIQWLWQIDRGCKVFGILYLNEWDGNEKGDYTVQLALDTETDVFTFSSETAKAIGQALISAHSWRDIWKDHAGMFLERDLLGEGS